MSGPELGSIDLVTTIRDDVDSVAALVDAVPVGLRSRVGHVIADGGSADGTFEALQAAAKTRPHLELVPSAPSSMAEGLNHAVRAATASHLVVLNADDGLEPGGLEALLRVVERPDPPAIAIGGLRVIDERGETFRIQRVRRMRVADILLARDYPWNPSCMAYARSLHRRAGPYDPREPLFDLAFLLNVARRVRPIRLEEVVGRFNMRRESLTVRRIESGELEGMIEDLFDRFERDLPWGERIGVRMRRGIAAARRGLRGRL